jgi:hypothetical protein
VALVMAIGLAAKEEEVLPWFHFEPGTRMVLGVRSLLAFFTFRA